MFKKNSKTNIEISVDISDYASENASENASTNTFVDILSLNPAERIGPINARLNNTKPKKKNAFFIGGGGTKGIYAIGVIKYFFRENSLFSLTNTEICGGTSVGSFFAAAISLGYNEIDMDMCSLHIDMQDLNVNFLQYPTMFFRLLFKKYLYNTNVRENMITQIINQKIETLRIDLDKPQINATEITYGDLKFLIKNYPNKYKHLIINSVDLASGKEIFFNTFESKTDNISIYLSLLATSAFPFVFKPVILYENPDGTYSQESTTDSVAGYFIDGGVATNNPLDYLLENYENFLDYDLWYVKFSDKNKRKKVTNIFSSVKQIISFMLNSDDEFKLKLIKDKYNLSTLNLNLSANTFDVYDKYQIQNIINKVFEECLNNQIAFS